MSLHLLKAESSARGARMLRTALGPAVTDWLDEPRVVEVMVDGNQAHLVRRRETIESLYALEQPLP